jgi:hypothetical protein
MGKTFQITTNNPSMYVQVFTFSLKLNQQNDLP